MGFLPFYTADNLSAPTLVESAPWEFCLDAENLAQVRAMPKPARRKWVAKLDTKWNVYTPIRAHASNMRCATGNPPFALRGIVCDYDAKSNIDEIVGHIDQMPDNLKPNFLEVSLSQKARLVWVFEREVLLPSPEFTNEIIKQFVDKFGARTLLAGYDDASEKPSQVWTNGGQWFDLKPTPVSWEVCFGVICSTAKKSSLFGKSEVPLEVVAEEVAKRFPGRWQGDFKLDAVGVRFWDAAADNPAGAQVKPDGMLCFTGNQGFAKWHEIFGLPWVEEQKILNLGRAGDGLHFDGRNYWTKGVRKWEPLMRADIVLTLKNRGLSDKTPKGQTVSEVDRVLHHIQQVNRVDGAAPLINYKPGLIEISGRSILNVTSLKPLQPAAIITGDPEIDFPWIWKFLNGHFARPELRPLEFFLTWMQRAYRSQLYHLRLMGQAVFLCGPVHNGKTLLCLRILSPLLGDRVANPFDYFTGETGFNDDLFDAALWAINDEEAPRSDASRQKFLARLKAAVVNPIHTYHPKFCPRVPVDWIGRVFVTLNDDAMSVGMLPEVSDATRDKMHFFASREYEGTWGENFEIEAIIAKELPLFAKWLLDVFQPPEDIVAATRMGMENFYDPVILDLSRQQIHAYNLLELLSQWIKVGGYWTTDEKPDEWLGTPTELLSQFSLCDHIQPHLRDWNVPRLAKALTALARNPDSGVLFDGQVERRFILSRDIVRDLPLEQ